MIDITNAIPAIIVDVQNSFFLSFKPANTEDNKGKFIQCLSLPTIGEKKCTLELSET